LYVLVLHYAHECGPDLNAFLSGRGSSRPSSPSKRRSNFLIPSVAGTSKGVSARKTFINLSPAQQFEALHQVAKEQVSSWYNCSMGGIFFFIIL
jgi:hypothetical protein